MARIVQVANFVSPTSGGLRTALRHLALGYADAGHEVVQIVPGATDRVESTAFGCTVRLRAPKVPRTGYRLLTDPARVEGVLRAVRADRLEVSDRLTLRGLGSWARTAGVPSVVISHERLDRVLGRWLPGADRPGVQTGIRVFADRSNRALAAGFDSVVCTTHFAAAEFERIGVVPRRVPLGVDLDAFTPDSSTRDAGLRRLAGRRVRIASAVRLSREKNPGLVVETVRHLVAQGLDVSATLAGDGPMRFALQRSARGLPIDFVGYLADRRELAAVLAGADVVVAPGPVETFGLAALEALACGTPVVADENSALAEIVTADCGRLRPGDPEQFAAAVLDLVFRADDVREAARRRAEQFPWSASIDGFLAVHGYPRLRAVS